MDDLTSGLGLYWWAFYRTTSPVTGGRSTERPPQKLVGVLPNDLPSNWWAFYRTTSPVVSVKLVGVLPNDLPSSLCLPLAGVLPNDLPSNWWAFYRTTSPETGGRSTNDLTNGRAARKAYS